MKKEIPPKLFAELSAKVMLIPDGFEIKTQYERMFEDKVITYLEYYELHKMLEKYDENISNQIGNIKTQDKELNAYEKAVENLKAFDEVGYELVDPSKRKEVRDLLVKHVNDEKLKN